MKTGILLLFLGGLVLVAALLVLRYDRRHPLSRDFGEPDIPEQDRQPNRKQAVPQNSRTVELEKTVIVPEDEL